jgi:hypothetical protein
VASEPIIQERPLPEKVDTLITVVAVLAGEVKQLKERLEEVEERV